MSAWHRAAVLQEMVLMGSTNSFPQTHLLAAFLAETQDQGGAGLGEAVSGVGWDGKLGFVYGIAGERACKKTAARSSCILYISENYLQTHPNCH